MKHSFSKKSKMTKSLKKYISILIRNKEKAEKLEREFPNLINILESNPESLTALGITTKEETKILEAALNFGQAAIENTCPTKLDTAFQAAVFLRDLRNKQYETAEIISLNSGNRIIARNEISRGGIKETTVTIQQIMHYALINNASKIILAHNHPGGNPNPSEEDIDLTRQLDSACRLMQIILKDHIIISPEGYYSFAESNKTEVKNY